MRHKHLRQYSDVLEFQEFDLTINNDSKHV